MRPVLELNGNDWTWILNEKSIHWTRNDIDTQSTGRSNLTAKMYRKRLATKRKLSFDNIKRLTTDQLVALNAELNRDTFTCAVIDGITGTKRTMICYNSSVEAATQIYDDINDEIYWEDIKFSAIEV